VVARFQVNSGGTFSLKDYFEPSNYKTFLDPADLDLGSSGFTILDPTTFVGNGVSRMGVIAGKNWRIYALNANNLGGFQQGAGNTDHVLDSILLSGPVWAGMGSYPLEGGYI
jgi:iron transport multicopper oxidase